MKRFSLARTTTVVFAMLVAFAPVLIPAVGVAEAASTQAVITWYLRNSNSSGVANLAFVYGFPTDKPIVGDWDGNGSDTPGVVRGYAWYLRNSNSSGIPSRVFTYGNPGDKPIVGDWNRDWIDTPGLTR